MSGIGITGILILLFLTAVYFVPTFVAFARNHLNKGAILALNLFLGWSLIGWVAALVWALRNAPSRTTA